MATQERVGLRGDVTPVTSSSGAQKSRDDDDDAASPSDTSGAADRAASRRSLSRCLSSCLRRGNPESDARSDATGASESSLTTRTLVLKGHTSAVFALAALDGCRLASSGANAPYR